MDGLAMVRITLFSSNMHMPGIFSCGAPTLCDGICSCGRHTYYELVAACERERVLSGWFLPKQREQLCIHAMEAMDTDVLRKGEILVASRSVFLGNWVPRGNVNLVRIFRGIRLIHISETQTSASDVFILFML